MHWCANHKATITNQKYLNIYRTQQSVLRAINLIVFSRCIMYTAAMKKQHVTLTPDDQSALESLLEKGTLPVKTFKRATALLELQRGKTLVAVAATLGVNYNTVARWRDGYHTHGLACLIDAPRPGRPVRIDGYQRAYITALACSDAPHGHARWSVRLLAEKVVEAGVCESLAYSTVGTVLKKTN